MRSAPVAPVITGNITTRTRSTRPAATSDRHRVMLPMVLIGSEFVSFIFLTASTASPRTRVEFDHSNGSSNVEENTTFGALPRKSVEACSSSPAPAGMFPDAKPYINRYVVAPINSVVGGCSPSHARYSGPSSPHQPGQP